MTTTIEKVRQWRSLATRGTVRKLTVDTKGTQWKVVLSEDDGITKSKIEACSADLEDATLIALGAWEESER